MKIEMILIISSIVIMSVLLLALVPRHKILHAHISFLFMQIQTWLFGAIAVEARLIEYPVRLMEYAYRISFTYEYFLFPGISVLFNLYYPNKRGRLYKIAYISFYPTLMTIIEVLLEKYTETVKYIAWTWYLSWITILITLMISYWYYRWFLRKIHSGADKA
jgi:hypothetical protein